MTKLKFTAFAMMVFSVMISCNSTDRAKDDTKNTSTPNETVNKTEISEKGHWSQHDRAEFLGGCIESAEAAYLKRGQVGDSATITSLCICAGKLIEQKYSLAEAGQMTAEQNKEIMMQAAQDCAPKPTK